MPDLEVLTPSLNDYDVLLYQPKGEVYGSNARVGNLNQAEASRACEQLLNLAADQGSHLVVTPEYSVPWDALIRSVLSGHAPPKKCLWALGCESITPGELATLESQFQGRLRLLHEDLNLLSLQQGVFLDPLAYLFNSTTDDGSNCLVLLIQFKTFPSIDADRIEGDNLICGTTVYVFGSCLQHVRLVTFICSDVFQLEDSLLQQVLLQTLILHIQLNPKPRHADYCMYRKYLYGRTRDETEILCLNWAGGVMEWIGERQTPVSWSNIGGSAWYLRPDKFDLSDTRLVDNHQKGLYYTRLKPQKWHVLYFNYCHGCYLLRASKVWHRGVVQAQSQRQGPRMHRVLDWDTTAGWGIRAASDDGFAQSISALSPATDPLLAMHQANPIAVERVLALTTGAILKPALWHDVTELDSCEVRDDEHTKRITFVQDLENSSVHFRTDRLARFVSFSGIMSVFNNWPSALADLSGGYALTWSANTPNSNVVAANTAQPATLVYIGEEPSPERLTAIGDLLKTALAHSKQDEDRLGVFYRVNGTPRLWTHPDSTRYDKPASTEATDIAGE